jgi:dUTP pyrophosphatase
MKIKLFDTTMPLPKYQTAGAAGFDLYARETVEIPAGEVRRVPLNVAIELPEGYWALMAARSSLHKKGVQLVNGIGVGDLDFRGDQDEYQAALLNFTDKTQVIERGERLVQMIILPYKQVELEQMKSLGSDDRGGFGSTG